MSSSNRIAALMIGRGGSSLRDKNILPVRGIPLLHYAAAAARGSTRIGRFYCSSDCEKILAAAERAGYRRIQRPPELAAATAQSSQVVDHALEMISRDGQVSYVVVQHANVATVKTETINRALEMLDENPDVTAVVPSHTNEEYHPYRSFIVGDDGILRSLAPVGASGNRQDLPEAVFFDHSFWAINLAAVAKHGPSDGPWPCMGARILPMIGEGCLDVHSLEDLKTTERWVDENLASLPVF